MEYRQRNLAQKLREFAGNYPVVTITGPRQSGKSTLCVETFPQLPRVSLELPDIRNLAREDPRGFLGEYNDGAIIDEVQHVPEILSYLQEEVDRDARPGRFILTGSEHLGFTELVSQSLAGRSGTMHLLPLSFDELRLFCDRDRDLFELLWAGAYPRIFDANIPPHVWLRDYVSNYVERDVRRIVNVGDLTSFGTFLRLTAASTGQELNLSRLGGDAGVTANTARTWLSVLEASFICFRVHAWTPNIRKQWVKAPKLHFFDSGLVCYLLGIRSADELRHHPLRGGIFESWVASEMFKVRANEASEPDLMHLRQSRGIEIDVIQRQGNHMTFVEAKSGQTIASDWFTSLDRVEGLLPASKSGRKMLVHGGNQSGRRKSVELVPWSTLPEALRH